MPPDIVVLHTRYPSATPTMLLRNPLNGIDGTEGVFLVASGDDRFLATAYAYGKGLRFDPCCMTPQDQRARAIAAAFADAESEAVAHAWSEPNMVLVIDNTQVLHGRAAVAADDAGRVLSRVAFHSKRAT
ncbi:TauD/TfdA family dioxygenase [Nocardia carnea]|uniref:TauD/TfdA family dioxygenase n=1 Tax=Nocardia carnea TaxID=37328 RepID=UPI002456A2BD|nr:TauD/TfdA family dioxygenase [Nocardia carnea]